MRSSFRTSAFLMGLFLLLAGCQGIQHRDVPAYSIDDFLGTTNFSGASFSPDKSKIMVSSNPTGIFNVYAIDRKSGKMESLTSSTGDSIFAIGYFPGDERFLYSSDQGGNELNHIYVHETDGKVKDLTPGDKLKARFLGWAHDDQSFFIGTNERDPRFFDLYEYAEKDYARTLIYQNDEAYDYADISPDRRYLALAKTVTNADSDIYLFDRKTGGMIKLTEHKGDVMNAPQAFSTDGKLLYYLTNDGSEFNYLMRYHLESRKHETVMKADWDILYAYFSKKGKYLIVGINNDARTELRIYESENMRSLTLPRLPDAEITSVSISRDEGTMAFYASSSRMPGDLFVLDFSGGKARKLTRSLNAKIDPQDLVDGKVVRFNSFDGLEIPGILFKPHQASGRNKVPALVSVHGGPGGQSRVGYRALTQYLVNHGYAVFAINNRGSSGYGKTFFHLDDRKHGEGDLDDCVASKKMLADTGYVDPDRIGIIGGSYGGYMVLAALAFRPEAFEVGVDIFGVSNWVRTVQSIPPWWESIKAALEKEMGSFEDEEYYRSISPLFHAKNIVKPLIVLQGANDPRVLKAESDEIVEAARRNGIPVEYVVFDDEGHGFRKKENQSEGYRAILEFLDRHLKGSPDHP